MIKLSLIVKEDTQGDVCLLMEVVSKKEEATHRETVTVRELKDLITREFEPYSKHPQN